ncbi:uncharacterized protein LOC117108533 [Anneissia japonica]|uniref:uncharacterized protein LOC117108533 n=1 Tax=Anneissia japonica TaxID=1529436 RepID=UPI0014258DFB|nr:uncharacterized protein LOC117108533 [Anneissia japonica]
MTKLLQLFSKIVKKHEGLEMTNYRTDQLKYRLRKDFPQLCFHKPYRRNQAEMVFTEELTTGNVLDLLSTSEEESSPVDSSEVENESEEIRPKLSHMDQEKQRTIYNAGTIVYNAIKASPTMSSPWPPTAEDINLDAVKEMVPFQLYNLIAWCVRATDEPTLTSYVDVSSESHLKLLSICQDIVYLTSKGKKQTPKSLGLGLTVRHLTGSSQVLKLLNKYGHCASWDTILGLETSLAQLQLLNTNAIPNGFAKHTPTTLVWDNIDFGEETLSGHGTTHHTNGIMLQSRICKLTSRSDTVTIRKGIRSFKPAPSTLEIYHRTKRQGPKKLGHQSQLNKNTYKPKLLPAFRTDLAFIFAKYADEEPVTVPGWTGFNMVVKGEMTLEQSAIHYLPVIEASPTEMNTVKTILEKSLAMADRLEVDHVVLVFDQAIYAKIQEIRWNNEEYKQRTVIRLGELHTCMSFLGVIGRRFKDAGLHDLLIEAEIIAPGSINGVLNGHHYNRSIRAHKLLFEALQRVRLIMFLESLPATEAHKYAKLIVNVKELYTSESFNEMLCSEELNLFMTEYDDFITKQGESCPTFSLWNSYIDMVQILLTFIRATRESDWDLHLAALRYMMPWFFAYDRMNYARYLPAYWLEMVNLPNSHPECHKELSTTGQWTVQRQQRHPFASIACDQAIEQTCNRDSKTNGGITSYTLNRGAVQRWILSQPQRAAITRQCEMMGGVFTDGRKPKDLDQSKTKRDTNAVMAIMSTLDSMVNPFDSSNDELVCFSSGVVATDAVKNDLSKALDQGEEAATNYIKGCLIDNEFDMHAPIKNMKLKTFSENNQLLRTKSGKAVSAKSDRKLFARLLIAGQTRKIDLPEILSYSLGNVSFPLANFDGSLAKTNKSALLHAIEMTAGDCLIDRPPENAALMIDGMALIQSIRDVPKTFGELADDILKQIINLAAKYKCSRVDFVTDRYPSISIKNVERLRRAESGTQKVQIYSKDQKTPKQWKKFLSDGTNKEALVEFLFLVWKDVNLKLVYDIAIYFTHGEECHILENKNSVSTSWPCDDLKCDHEEADTRLLLHAKHASKYCKDVIIRSPDTDVSIIALSLMDKLASNLFFLTGTGRKSRIIDLQKVASVYNPSVREALIGLHIFTGCDSTSAFYSKGKKKALAIAQENTDYLDAFTDLGRHFDLKQETISNLETFVCKLYGQVTTNVNDARYKIFCLSSASEQSLPPTKDAMIQHCKRCNYQAAIHRRSCVQWISAPSPVGHGWQMTEDLLTITWMTNAPAPEVLLQSVNCSCKVGKCQKGRCSCLGSNLPCTDLCKCKDCQNTNLPAVESIEDFNQDFDDDDDDDYDL